MIHKTRKMSSHTETTTKHPARNPTKNVKRTISLTESTDKHSSGTPSDQGKTMGGGPLKTPVASQDPPYVSPRRREAILNAPSMIKAGHQSKLPSRSQRTSKLSTGNQPNIPGSSVDKRDEFNFSAVAFAPLVTKQTRPPRKKKNKRYLKQLPELSEKPNETEANRPEVECGNLTTVGKPSTVMRRVTFRDELVKMVAAKNVMRNPERTFPNETKVHENAATISYSPLEGQVSKRNNDISKDSVLSSTKDGKRHDDGEGARPANETSHETAVVGRAVISKPLLTERLIKGKENEDKADDITAVSCQDETIIHSESKRNSVRDEESQVCTKKNLDLLTMTSEQLTHERYGFQHGVDHPTIRKCKVTPSETSDESINTKYRGPTFQYPPAAEKSDKRRQQEECFPDDDDGKILVIDETRCKASGDDDESVARRGTAENTACLLGTVSSVDGTKGSPCTTQHQATLVGVAALPVEFSQNDIVQATNTTETRCGPSTCPPCKPKSRPNNSFKTKSQEAMLCDKVAVPTSSSAVSFTKPSLVLCGGRSSSYSSPQSLPTKTSRGSSGGSSSPVPESTSADTSSRQTRIVAARLQTSTSQSSPLRSTLGLRCPPQGQNTIQEQLISEMSVDTRRLLAPSYFKSRNLDALEQSRQKSSSLNQVNRTNNHSSAPNTITTSSSVQILANTNFRGPHYMVMTRKVAIPQHGPHQAKVIRPQNPPQHPQFAPQPVTVFYPAPQTSTGGPAQYQQMADQSSYPGGQGSFGIGGKSSQQRFKQSQSWHQRNHQAVRMKQPSVKTSSQHIRRPAVFAAPAPIAYPNQTVAAIPQWTQQSGWSSKLNPPFLQRAAPPPFQVIPPLPLPPQSQQLTHQSRIMKLPSGTREQHLIPGGRQATVTPSSLIPNGTLFVQTPQGLVQIQQHGQMNQTQAGSQQQIATRNTTCESVGRSNTFERQNQARHGSSVSKGHRPSAAAVATLTPAPTVLRKSDELTGVRLPYPMPTQKQLLFLSRKTETPNRPETRTAVPPSDREVKADINSHTTKHTCDARSLSDSNTKKNRPCEVYTSVAEGDGKKSTSKTTRVTTTNGSKEGTQLSKTLAVSMTNEDVYKDKHNVSSRKGSLRGVKGDASQTKSCIKTKVSQPDDSEQQHNKSVSGLPRCSYVKFLDSSVTVNCMYFPKAPSVLRVNENRETGVEEESKDLSPSETQLDYKESDAVPSDGCKDGKTSVNFSEASPPLSTEPEPEDETKVQDNSSTEGPRRGGNNKASVKYTEAESDDEDDDETWHPGPRKSPSRYTRRFRNPRTGGLSKINIQTSATEGSVHPPEETSRSLTTEMDTRKRDMRIKEPKMKSGSKATCVKVDHEGFESKRDVEIMDKLVHPEADGVSKNVFERKIDSDESSPTSTSSSGSSFKAERKIEASQTKRAIGMTPKTPEKRLNSNSNKHKTHAGKTDSDDIPGTPNAKAPTVSNTNSPSKRPHQRSSQSRSSDSDNLSSKYPKQISSKKGFHQPADKATSPHSGQPRASPRRLHDRHTKQSPAPLWQRVLKMFGLKKKKPVRSPPSGVTVWHKRRSSSLVLAESLAESARRLEKTKDVRSECKETFADADGLPLEKKGTGETNRSLTKEKQRQEGNTSGSKKSSKKKKQMKTKKHHKRRKIVKKSRVSPESTTDPASGSLTSIDFDARRQTRSRTRRERDSDSVSSLADSASSASPSSRRGRRTLASISAQTWEDCYRCTYLKWKETNESPEKLTNDEGFKVMTNELATPSRAGPSKDKKCFQKLLMSKWENIVQTAQTGTVEEKIESNVGDEGWPLETTSFSFVDTPPVASELSICTTDCKNASLFSQQDDWNIYKEDTHDLVSSQVDIKSEEPFNNDAAAPSNTLSGSGDKNVSESYGYPPVLSPIQDCSETQDEQGITYPSPDTSSFFIPQTLTEETLQLLAESGSIDSDLSGLQAFALFMPESGGADQYGDPSSTSPPPQPVSDEEEDLPPVISCHKLNTDDITHEDRIVDVEEIVDNTNQSQSTLLYIPVPLTSKEPDSQGYVPELPELSEAPHPGPTGKEERDDSAHQEEAETGNRRDHGNEEEGESVESTILQKFESSIEEGEIIDETEFPDYPT